MWGIAILLSLAAIGGTIAAYVLAPKPPKPKEPSLDDIGAPTAEPGRPIPVVFGTVVLQSPNVVWYGDPAYEPVKS